MSKKESTITYQQIESIASGMMSKGFKPTVRAVMEVSGGNTAKVSEFLKDFFKKRDDEVHRIADEIGSSDVAKLIAGGIQSIVDKKTIQMTEIIERQDAQLNEFVDIVKEIESNVKKVELDAQSRIEIVTNDTALKIEKANSHIKEIKKTLEETIRESEKAQSASDNAVYNAENKASALVDAANSRVIELEQESKSLREQVKFLSIEEAKYELQESEFLKLQSDINKFKLELSENKQIVAKLTAERAALEKDVARLEGDSSELKSENKKITQYQGELLLLQKEITSLKSIQSDLEKENTSMRLMLSNLEKDNSSS